PSPWSSTTTARSRAWSRRGGAPSPRGAPRGAQRRPRGGGGGGGGWGGGGGPARPPLLRPGRRLGGGSRGAADDHRGQRGLAAGADRAPREGRGRAAALPGAGSRAHDQRLPPGPRARADRAWSDRRLEEGAGTVHQERPGGHISHSRLSRGFYA